MLVCNGPSLNQTDFSLIRNETSMGLNKIFLGFKRLKFYPRYYVAINKKVIEQSAEQIRGLNCIRFIKNLGAVNPVPESALTYIIEPLSEQRFHQNLSEGFFEGFTVTFAALQIAFYMGFSCVAIVGMDHRYEFQGNPNDETRLEGADPNHFDPGYFGNQTWDNPDLANSEHFYAMAREVFETAGRRIVDCTIGGACPVFERSSLQEVLS